MAKIEWSAEQQEILDHDSRIHALVLAGPGTGKSTVVIALAELLAEHHGSEAVRLATFTRAATAELADKAVEGELEAPVTTVHSFALRLLRGNPQWNRLPLPIRIPDDWESKELLYADLRDRLAAAGWTGLRRTKVERLVRELASRWEALDEDLILEAEVDPDLRNAFVAGWQRQREVFGYSLFAEMPWYAYELIEDHPDAELGGLGVLVVDEYQDLNACELRLVRSLSRRGVTVIGVGDDEQSIYSWRMAAPQGIRQFEGLYDPSTRYTLTSCRRFGEAILRPSQQLISTSPDRIPDRPPLQAHEDAPAGEFAYLSFEDAHDERRGVLALIRRQIEGGTSPDRVAVLMKSDFRGNWSRDLRLMLEQLEIPVRDIEAATEPLNGSSQRSVVAACRLLLDDHDDLAWWTLLKERRGCADEFIRLVADSAYEAEERFHQRLLRLADDPVGGTANSQRSALAVVAEIMELREDTGILDRFDNPAELLAEVASRLDLQVEATFMALVLAANERLVAEGSDPGLQQLLGQLEPVAKDLALRAGGIALMTIASSKGLTFDVPSRSE